jgi:hypothetical protein
MPSWKESGLDRIGWGAYPHVLLKHFLVQGEALGEVERLALRILIVYGEVEERFLTKRLQKEFPTGKDSRERTVESVLQIKMKLRTFYSLNITRDFKKFVLVYNIDSDVKQKWKAKELKKLRLERKEGKENEDLPEEYKPTSYHGETIFG